MIYTALFLLNDILSLKTDGTVMYPQARNWREKNREKYFFVGILKATTYQKEQDPDSDPDSSAKDPDPYRMSRIRNTTKKGTVPSNYLISSRRIISSQRA
jgi:hypothetical protein